MEKKMKILAEYEQSDSFKRMHLFLQFRDLRPDFQQIEHKKKAPLRSTPIPAQKEVISKCCWFPRSSIKPLN